MWRAHWFDHVTWKAIDQVFFGCFLFIYFYKCLLEAGPYGNITYSRYQHTLRIIHRIAPRIEGWSGRAPAEVDLGLLTINRVRSYCFVGGVGK